MRVLFLTVLYYMFALSSFINPYYGVIGYTFISIIRPEQLTWGSSRISNVFAVSIVSLALSSIVRKEKLFYAAKQPFFMFFSLFVIGSYYTTVVSKYTVYDEVRGSFYYLNQLPQILCFCICLFSILIRLSEEQFQKYLVITLSFVTFMGLWGIDQSLRGNIGVEGLFGYDRCAVTSVFVLYLPLAYFFVSNKKRSIQLFGIASFIVCFALVILTESRAGFLGLCTVMLNIFWYSRNRRKFIKWSVLLLLLGLFVLPTGYLDRFDTMQTQDVTENEITDYSSASRLLMWKVSLNMIADHPFLGVGKLNFARANKEYAVAFEGTVDRKLFNTTFGFEGERSLSHTHNTFLNVLVEGGIVTALPFFLLFWVPLAKGWKLVKKYRATHDHKLDLIIYLNAGILGFLVTGLFGTLSQVDFVYWNLTILYFVVLKLETSLASVESGAPVAVAAA